MGIVVGYAEDELVAHGVLDGEHAIIEEQADEDAWVGLGLGRERLLNVSNNLSLFGNGRDSAKIRFLFDILVVSDKNFLKVFFSLNICHSITKSSKSPLDKGFLSGDRY